MGSPKSPQIPMEEYSFTASRSGGPGGQNVNKLNTRVTVTFNIETSPSLTEEQREQIRRRLSRRISQDGNLQISSQTYRSQFRNRQDAMERMQLLIDSAFVVRRKRLKTRPTRSSVQKRLESKGRRSQLKRFRRKPESDS